MKVEDFKFQLLAHAHALRHSAIARSTGHDLDEKTAMWIITDAAWREFCASQDMLKGYAEIDLRCNRKRLLGIPVRVTYRDEEGTPPVQLVMEPMLAPRRPALP